MKKSTIVLGMVSVMVLCLAACGKPKMSFEEAVDAVANSEIQDMMANAENYEQNFKVSSDFSRSEDNVQANVIFSTNSKQNVKDSEGETKISFKIDASGDGDEGRENIKIGGDAIIKYLTDAVYFSLNSLDVDGPEDFRDEFNFDLSGIKGQWFSFELTDEMKNKIYSELPEDFDINNLKNEEALNKLNENLKKSINNEGSMVYNGMYSEFNGYNAWKFSINKEKVLESFVEYFKEVIPEEYVQELEDFDATEVLKDFPFKNLEGYLVITGKDRVQVVVENLDIEKDYSVAKINGTFGKDRYELSVKDDGEQVFILSAKLNMTHYDVSMKIKDLEALKGTITPKKFDGKIIIDFDLSIKFGDDDENMKIPLQGLWSWEKISKFNVEIPKDSRNLLEDIMENVDYDAVDLQGFAGGFGNQGYGISAVSAGILAAALAPRMQSAQDRARDVARKVDLSQIQTAIVTSQGDKGMWPGMDKGAARGATISSIEKELQEAGMSSVPKDPNNYNINYGLGKNYKNDSVMGEYLYLVTKRNGVQNGGFVLMAKTEVEGGSNRVVCKDGMGLNKGYIVNETDIAKIQLCSTVSKGDSCGINEGVCTYTDDDELRYILMY